MLKAPPTGVNKLPVTWLTLLAASLIWLTVPSDPATVPTTLNAKVVIGETSGWMVLSTTAISGLRRARASERESVSANISLGMMN